MTTYFNEAMSPEERLFKFQEAATTGEFPDLLRSDYKDMLLEAYGSVEPQLFPLCFVEDSNNETETYRGMKNLGPTTQIVPQGSEFPERMLGQKTAVSITNYKYGDIVSYTREMGIYNKLSDFKRLAVLQGQALADGLEENLADALETTTNTTASASTLTLNRANLETLCVAFRKSTTTDAEGRTIRHKIIPDTLIVPPDIEPEASRLLNTVNIPGSANNDVNWLLRRLKLVVCDRLSSTSLFYVAKANWPMGLTFQKVIGPPPETFTQDIKSGQISDNVFRYDKISYRADMIYGIGVKDAAWCIRSTT